MSTAQLPSVQQGGAAVGVHYILEVVQQIGDGLALGVGEDIIVVDLRPAGSAAEEQLAAEIAHGVGRGLASRRCRSRPTAMGGFLSRARAAAVKGSLADELIGGRRQRWRWRTWSLLLLRSIVHGNTKLLSIYCCLLACE